MGQAPVKKELFDLGNGCHAEAIYFHRPEKQVICFSTQINCPVGCTFCASGGGKTINLSTQQMVDLVEYMYEKYAVPDTIMLFSVMGEGEPLLNYYNVMTALKEITYRHPNSRISLSTSGIKPDKITELAFDLKNGIFDVPFKLQISIHSLENWVRHELMPNNARSIWEIMDAIKIFHKECPNTPVELNFAMINGFTDTAENAYMISLAFRDEHIKLSQYNPIERSDYVGTPVERIKNMQCFLVNTGMSVEFHATDGSGIGAACGQIRGMKK